MKMHSRGRYRLREEKTEGIYGSEELQLSEIKMRHRGVQHESSRQTDLMFISNIKGIKLLTTERQLKKELN